MSEHTNPEISEALDDLFGSEPPWKAVVKAAIEYIEASDSPYTLGHGEEDRFEDLHVAVDKYKEALKGD